MGGLAKWVRPRQGRRRPQRGAPAPSGEAARAAFRPGEWLTVREAAARLRLPPWKAARLLCGLAREGRLRRRVARADWTRAASYALPEGEGVEGG